MTTKFEDAVAALKAKTYETPEMLQVLQLMVEQNERIKNLEHASIATKHQVDVVDERSTAHGVSIGSLAQDRDATAQRVKVIETKPATDTKKIEDLEKRVTAVEGAVGSKAYKKIETKTVAPLPADKVEAETKPSILPAFMQSKPETPPTVTTP